MHPLCKNLYVPAEYSEYKSSDINFINNVLYYNYVDDSITDYYKGDIFSTDIKLNFCNRKYDFVSQKPIYNDCINIEKEGIFYEMFNL